MALQTVCHTFASKKAIPVVKLLPFPWEALESLRVIETIKIPEVADIERVSPPMRDMGEDIMNIKCTDVPETIPRLGVADAK